MTGISLYQAVENKIIQVRGQNVILDSDVAGLYGVETKRVNEAVKNNPEKFPSGYLIKLQISRKMNWSKFSTGSIFLNILRHNQKPLPKKASSIEFNLALVKFKYSIKKKGK
jgi:hypothetical protein